MRLIQTSLLLVLGLFVTYPAAADDLSRVPLWDAETRETFTNRFGGKPLAYNLDLTRVDSNVHQGKSSYLAETRGLIPKGGFGFIQADLFPTRSTGNMVAGRDLRGYESLEFWLDNHTGDAFTLSIELKDYRDQTEHSAVFNVPVASTKGWSKISVPLDLETPGWRLRGLVRGKSAGFISRLKSIGLVVKATRNSGVEGEIFFDDMALIERGGEIDVATAPARVIVERLAKRQWSALWGSRNRENGLIPSHSTSSDHGALNVTAAVVKMLPRAVDNGWVGQQEAFDYMQQVVASFHTVMDDAKYAPGRYLNWTTLRSEVVAEETNIDAAFLALGLHQFKNRSDVPSDLRRDIHRLQNRFNLAAFEGEYLGQTAWAIAYHTDDEEMSQYAYNGYSGETWVLSLAAHLADNHHVDIGRNYHSGILRVRERLTDSGEAPVVATLAPFRAAFLQWLFPLFADVSERGSDNYPEPSLAVNPRANADAFQREVHAYYDRIGRGMLLQPDAGADTTGLIYNQFSAYDPHGQESLFMPWSAAFSLLGDPQVGEAAIRHHLLSDLEGPFGLSDSAQWATGADAPEYVTAFHDLWNVSLSTMALFEFLYNDAAAFADLPEVREALDQVFDVVEAAPTSPSKVVSSETNESHLHEE